MLWGARVISYIMLAAVALTGAYSAGNKAYASAHCSGPASSLGECDLADFAGLEWATIAFIGTVTLIVAVEVMLWLRRRSRATA
jgi:hypothetical protein